MKQTRKGGNWHVGMKLNVGADKHGIAHTVCSRPGRKYISSRSENTSV